MDRETAISAGRKENRTAARRRRGVNRPVDRRRVERLAIALRPEPFHFKESRIVPGSWWTGFAWFRLAVRERRSAQRDEQKKKDQDG